MAYRGGKRAVRAGNSIAHGRVPSIGVGLGVAGFGVRVGTRGLGVKAPLARVRMGSSGFRVTVGQPGIAHVSVRPLKPSMVLGAGPLRLNVSRHPGLGARVGMVGFGVTTQPLVWARIGAFRMAVPGQYLPSTTRWHEEIDRQWRADYQRRPPSFLADLHSVISETESSAISLPFSLVPDIGVPHVGYSPLDWRDKLTILWKSTVAGFGTEKGWRKIKLIPVARAIMREMESRTAEELGTRSAEADSLQNVVNQVHSEWRNGDEFVNSIVCNASFEEFGCPANVVSIDRSTVTVLVLLPDIDDVHPEKPAFTPQGAPTVKKKTKRDRVTTHTEITSATALASAVIGARRTFGPSNIRVVGVMRDDRATKIVDLPVVVDTTINRNELLPGRAIGPWLIDFDQQPTILRHVLPDAVPPPNTEIAAVSVDIESPGDMTSATFWIEIAEARRGVGAGNQPGHTPPTAVPTAGASAPTGPKHQATQQQPRPTVPFNNKKVVNQSVVDGPADVQRPMRTVLRMRTVAATESRLLRLSELAKAASLGGSAAEVSACLRSLIDELPNTPEGADDEAELVFQELFNALVAIATPTELTALASAASQAHSSVRSRFDPIISELAGMVAIRQRVTDHVHSHPGTLQSTIAREINSDKKSVETVCWFLDHFDIITRSKRGNSYVLDPP